MTMMAAMPIYGKIPSKIFFSETNRLISRKLGVKHRWLKYFNVYINHDPVMTLTKFMARSAWVAYAFELGKLLKCHLKGKASRKLANGQNIKDSEKRKWPKGFICPCTGTKCHNHGGDSIDTTCAVVRDVTAYIAVVRVFRFSSEYYGCRYHRCPYFSAHRANRSSLISAFITENCQEGIYHYYKRLSSFLNIKTITRIYF